jgi:hypothetical protein
MAQRYGGEFSPENGKSPAVKAAVVAKKPRVPRFWRAGLMFVAPLALAFRAFTFPAPGMAITLVALGILVFAAKLTRDGLIAEAAFHARRVARRPEIPRKFFGSVLTAIGLFLAGLAEVPSTYNPETGAILFQVVAYTIITGVTGGVLHTLAFGMDPMRDKGMEGIDEFQTDRVARVVDAAEKQLEAMADAVKRSGSRPAQKRVAQFSDTARALFRMVENDPRDLTAARKFLGIYLRAGADATVTFADVYAANPDRETLARYLALLDDLEENYAAKTGKLLLNGKADLDVEIDVLRKRLHREGMVTGDAPAEGL